MAVFTMMLIMFGAGVSFPVKITHALIYCAYFQISMYNGRLYRNRRYTTFEEAYLCNRCIKIRDRYETIATTRQKETV